MVSSSALRDAETTPIARVGEHDAIPVVPPPLPPPPPLLATLSRYTPYDQPSVLPDLMLYQPFLGVPDTTVTIVPFGMTFRIFALVEPDVRRLRSAFVRSC